MFMLSLMQPSGLYELEEDSLEAISAQLLQMIQMKSHELYTHSIQVANYSVSIAAKMGLPQNEIIQIKHAALLHDVGLLTMPNSVLKKAPYFNRQEMSRFRQHPVNGANMIENYPCCQEILPYIRYHHERWDGSGYPKHLRGANIPLGARIIGIADYYDSAINPSTELWSKTRKTVKQELFSGSGIYFDPDVVRAFIEILS
ncbi:HD-GYP domain-containing protein [Veillonella magna]|uniref:HD-GYP domain-containing protein n=1 Tax=Veillonella magna TaxID=464322 RepID=UPI00258A1867|nr:HD domain-containing phosphohydrolase [Veillonella magna]